MVKLLNQKKIPEIGADTVGTNDLVMIKNRIGRVLVDYKMLLKTDQDIVKRIFSRFYPIKAENNFINGIIEYYGYSKEFDRSPDGKMIPIYQIKIDSIEKEVAFIKLNNEKRG